MKSLLKYVTFALVAGILLYGFGAAAAENVFTQSFSMMGALFKNIRLFVYVLGAFALVGIAVGALFGKLSIKWLAYVAVGLGIIAVADLVISYAQGARKGGAAYEQGKFTAGEFES